MKVVLTLSLLLLHSEIAFGIHPTYDELKSQLEPVNLQPNGGDQYFFFIVPVQKNDEPNVILQMAQAQDTTSYANGSIAATRINTKDNFVDVSTNEDMDLSEIFTDPEENNGTSEFNFQVPVVVPLDFRFTYDVNTASEVLPQCTVDSRTWKENVISNIAEKLQLPGEQTWDHAVTTKRIRIRKDVISSITADYLTSLAKLTAYADTLMELKMFSDLKYASIFNNVTTLTSGHVSAISEAVDTYQLILNAFDVCDEAADGISTETSVTVIKTQVEILKPRCEETLEYLQQALMVVRELRQQEDLEDDEEVVIQ